MGFKLLPFDYQSEELFRLQLKWENDFEIRHLSSFFPNEEAYRELVTEKALKERWYINKSDPLNHRYMILSDGEIVGHANFHVGHACVDHDPFTAWIGIVIGERSAQGKGLGKFVMDKLEEEIRELGVFQLELGVFEFNLRARKLYDKMGYREKNIIPNFTWWDGRMWADIRMSKLLT